MKSFASGQDFLNDLNAVRLEDEELARVLAEAKKIHAEGEADQWTGIMTTIQIHCNAPEKAKAIIFRLQALALMVQNDQLGEWILGYGTGIMPDVAEKALLSAAAGHPLSIVDGDVSFERESFLHRVLEAVESHGNCSN